MKHIKDNLTQLITLFQIGVLTLSPVAIQQNALAQPNQQQGAYQEEKKNADKSGNASTAMAITHGTVSAVCFAACATTWTGGWGEGACTVGSLGAGIGEAVATGNIASAGMSGAMFILTNSVTGFSGLKSLGQSLGLVAAPAATAGKGAAKGGSKSGKTMSCVTGALEAGQAVMSAMAASEAKKTSNAAQDRLDSLKGPGVPTIPTDFSPSGREVTQLQPGTIGNRGGSQLGGGDPNQQDNGRNGSPTNDTGSVLATGVCDSAPTTYLQAAQCALSTNSNLNQNLLDPRIEDAFKKLTGMDPVSYFKDKDMASAIGQAGTGKANFLDPDGLKRVAKALYPQKEQLQDSVGVASGGGGGGAKAGGEESPPDFAGLLAGMVPKADDKKETSQVERLSFALQNGRDPASLADDPTISIFDRITYRYQIVSKQIIFAPANPLDSSATLGSRL